MSQPPPTSLCTHLPAVISLELNENHGSGYVTAGLIVTYWGEEICPELSCSPEDTMCHHDVTHGGHEGCHNPRWRIPLYIQAVGVLAFAPLFAYVKGRHFNARGGPAGRIKHRTAKYIQKLGGANSPLEEWNAGDWLKEDVRRFNYEESDLGRLGESPGTLSTVHAQSKLDADSAVHHLDAIDGLHLGESLGMMELFHHEDHNHEASGSLTDSSVWKQLELMMKSSLFVALTLALSGLYFVVTGIQFWVTDYLTMPVAEGGMGQDTGLVVICFSITSLTGPTAGVFFGGWIIDRQGGYKCETGKAAMDTLRTCCYFGIGAVVSRPESTL